MSTLQQALETLSEAHGAKALARAFGVLRGQVLSARKSAGKQWGTLSQTFTAAMQIWDAQKADGVPQQQRIDALDKSLRLAWPVTREWKYLCARCADYGLEMHNCPGDASCGRDKKHLPHEYGTPCWCSAGNRFRVTKPTGEDFTQAGKAKPGKVRNFSQVGR